MIELSHQEAVLFELLKRNRWIPLPQILATGIAQYNARLFGLCQKLRGRYRIENRTEVIKGKKHSWFRLVRVSEPRHLTGVGDVTSPPENPHSQQQLSEATLFDISPRLQYPD